MTEFIQTMTQDMVGHDTELQFRTSFDDSSKGAALIAAKHPFWFVINQKNNKDDKDK